MSRNTLARTHYRVPTASTRAEISLDEFSREEIDGYLRHLNGEREPRSSGGSDFTFDGDEMNRIGTLILCGQRYAAREYVCAAISEHLGRKL